MQNAPVQRHQLEDSLRQSEEKYRTLFESIDEGFCVIEVLFDDDGKPFDYRFLEVNPAFEKQTGLVNAIGKRVRDLVPNHENHWYEIYGRIALTGEPLRFEDRAEALNYWYDVYAYRYNSPEKHQVAVLFKDISERKRSEESLHRAHAHAEQTNRMKDEFLATLSHELRTPLNAILGWANLLRTSQLDLDTQKKGLETIERNAHSQAQLINDLLDVSRILTGKLRMEMQTVELADVVERAINTVLPSAQAKSIHINTSLDRTTGLISGDLDRLSQIFWNLLTNAIKFTPRGGHIEVIMERVGSGVQVRIRDSGQGISPEFLPFVFERFRQADASSTRSIGGLGIGLALVRHLMEAHGGTVRADSEGLDKGSVFAVTFPLTALRPVAATPQPHEAHLPAVSLPDEDEIQLPSLSDLRILVVDDDPDARTLIQVTLSQRGAHVEVAESAPAASALIANSRISKTPFDILVSDIGLPKEDGHSLLRHIRREEERLGGFLPAIALTAYATHKDRMNALLAGFQIHIAKPVDPMELVATIASLSGRTKPTT
ncbi:response regulator [bacterium]|nr:MAG: response regulator [bacterium]